MLDNIYYQATSVILTWYRCFLMWCHVTKSSINILSLICFAWNRLLLTSHISGLVFDVILLWEIHSRKPNQQQNIYYTFTDCLSFLSTILQLFKISCLDTRTWSLIHLFDIFNNNYWIFSWYVNSRFLLLAKVPKNVFLMKISALTEIYRHSRKKISLLNFAKWWTQKYVFTEFKSRPIMW
jgi:hypothetical protein